jgi:CHAD domain-containing protein
MAYKLKPNKKLPRQMKKICNKMMTKALVELGRRSVRTRGEGVHNARKKLKQLRGMLRFMRYGISKKQYKRENQVFRDAGRPLSDVRDADVMIETLDQLIDHYRDEVKRKSFSKLKRTLTDRRTAIRKELLSKKGAMGKVATSLKKSAPRIRKWATIPNDYKVLLSGIEATYLDGKKELEIAMQKKSTEALHQWRKSVKYLRYQLEVLEPVWPTVISSLVQETHQLADQLGLDHDLSVLENLVVEECNESLRPGEKELLTALLNQRRMELQNESIAIGQKVFAESGKDFSNRLKGYWKSWQKDSSVLVAA